MSAASALSLATWSNSRSREISAFGMLALIATSGVPPQNWVLARAGVRTIESQSNLAASDAWQVRHEMPITSR